MIATLSPQSSDFLVSTDHDEWFPSTMPIVREIKYPNINNDIRLKKKVVRYFLDKATEWVSNDYLDALTKYFKFVNNKIVLDSDMQKKDMTDDEKDAVMAHVLKRYLGKRVIAKVIAKLHHTKNINWYDMRDHKSTIRKALYKKLKKYIMKSM